MRSNADDLSPEGAEPRVTVAPSHAPVQEEEEEEEEEDQEIEDTDIQQKVCRSRHPLLSKALGSMSQSIIKTKFSSNSLLQPQYLTTGPHKVLDKDDNGLFPKLSLFLIFHGSGGIFAVIGGKK